MQTISCNLLPLELVSFTGWYNGSENELHWTTETEINSDHFELQKSLDGNLFTGMAEIPAAGNSLGALQYAFSDDVIMPGVQYYRLKMIDLDGSYSMSNIVAIRTEENNADHLLIFPNPASGNIHLEILAPAEGAADLEWMNMLGEKVKIVPIWLQEGVNTFDLPVQD